MNIEPDELYNLLMKTGIAYNQCDFAKSSGFMFSGADGYFLQAKLVVQNMPSKSAVFLDIGTGKGIIPRMVAALGIKSISVDNQITGGFAIESVREAGVEAYYCDISQDQLPLDDNSADCILFADVIEHLQNSPKPVIREIYRVLKPGGVCIATTPNACRLTTRVKVALGYSNWPYIGDFYDLPFHGGHHHEYTVHEFKEVFCRESFSIQDIVMIEEALKTNVSSLSRLQSRVRSGRQEESTDHPLISFAKIPLMIITRLLPTLRSDMCIVAKK